MKKKEIKQSTKKSFLRRLKSIMLIALASLLGIVVILTGWLFILSPGKIEPYRDKGGNVLPGSIAEKTYVTIGGVKQGMFIKGKNINNPVLLFLHGGPGMPTYFLTKQYPTGLEDNFTVCYWEQRGAGISYSPDLKAGDITVEQYISDAIEVTNYLRERFGKDKIYLLGHSWGSFIGLQAAAKEPELYYAYIGISQITNQTESEKLAYQWMMNQYTAAENKSMADKLKQYPVLEDNSSILPWFKSSVRDAAMHELGIGTMHNMKSVESGIFLPFLGTQEYTLGEKYTTFFVAKPFLREKTNLVDRLFSTDLTVKVPKLEIPIYFFSGSYDLTVNHDLNKTYFEKLEAPLKGYYTFSQSAHSPMHEEPGRFIDIMVKDVLNAATELADKE